MDISFLEDLLAFPSNKEGQSWLSFRRREDGIVHVQIGIRDKQRGISLSYNEEGETVKQAVEKLVARIV